MTVEDLFSRLTAALDRAEVPYMVTGSYASSIHSVPRATRDIDIIIFPTREQLTKLIGQLPGTSYYAELDAALERWVESGTHSTTCRRSLSYRPLRHSQI